MTRQQISLPRWLVATLAGLISAAIFTAVIYFGTELEFGLCAFVGGGLGLVIALLVARWFTAAAFVMGVLEVTVSALAAVVSILAAVVGALS
jgi:hypothetical protein